MLTIEVTSQPTRFVTFRNHVLHLFAIFIIAVSLQSQALALTRGCKGSPPLGERGTTSEKVVTPAPNRPSTPPETVVSPPSVKEEFDQKSPSPGKYVIYNIINSHL